MFKLNQSSNKAPAINVILDAESQLNGNEWKSGLNGIATGRINMI